MIALNIPNQEIMNKNTENIIINYNLTPVVVEKI